MRRLALLLTALLTAGLLTAAPAVAAAPTITSFTPTSGKINTPVTITGTGFAAPATVRFGGVAAGVVSVKSATSIVANVPLTATSGTITVTTSGGTATSAASFTVTPGLYVSPLAVGPPTSLRTVYFSGFGPYEAVDVYFGVTDLALASADVNGVGNVAIAIPRDAVPGPNTITAVGRHSGYSARAPFTVRTDWPQYGFTTGHRAVNGYEATLAAGNVDELSRVWRVAGGPGPSGTPAIVGGVVYEGFPDGTVRALDANTGAQKWSYTMPAAIRSGVSVVGGTVYVVDMSGLLVALNATTGVPRWSYQLAERTRRAPVVAGNQVYVATAFSGHLYALSLSGALVWQQTFAGEQFLGAPAVLGQQVYVASTDRVRAFDTVDGSLTWSSDDFAGEISTGAVAADDLVVFGTDTGSEYALYAESGGTAWTYPDLDNAAAGDAAVAYGRVFVASALGTVYALREVGGRLIWSAGTSSRGGVTVANRVVYATGNGATTALASSTGDVLTALLGGDSGGEAVVTDGTLTFVDYAHDGLVRYALTVSADAARPPRPAALRPDRSLHRQP